MGSSTKTSKITKQQAIKKHRKNLDGLTTREAQVVRMVHSVAEPSDAEVGQPPEGTSDELRQRLLDIEAGIFERIRSAARDSSPKRNIVQKLKDQ